MSDHTHVAKQLNAGWAWKQPDQDVRHRIARPESDAGGRLPAAITRAASKQTYLVIRFLVDRDRIDDAFRAYAYFRWVDDHLDQQALDRSQHLAFVERQQALVAHAYLGTYPPLLIPEEQRLVELIRANPALGSSLHLYIDHLMQVMAFDASRRGRLISQAELEAYSRHLAAGVTEAMHYFIDHGVPTPRDESRYLAVRGAHITHMLRDTHEDVTAGYFNIPREYLEAHGISPLDIGSDAYRGWVQSRVQLARACFKAGKDYLARIRSVRCRIAGYTYMARFEGVLRAIEREGYRLRAAYPECKQPGAILRMIWTVLTGVPRVAAPDQATTR